jgi:hypothetical protein
MVAASKKPVSELVEVIRQINWIQSRPGRAAEEEELEAEKRNRHKTQRNHLDTKVSRNAVDVDIIPTERYTLCNQGERMATIHTESKIAVFYHPAHYVYKKNFDDKLKPLVDYLFREGYTLMSQGEYEERTKPGNN